MWGIVCILSKKCLYKKIMIQSTCDLCYNSERGFYKKLENIAYEQDIVIWNCCLNTECMVIEYTIGRDGLLDTVEIIETFDYSKMSAAMAFMEEHSIRVSRGGICRLVM